MRKLYLDSSASSSSLKEEVSTNNFIKDFKATNSTLSTEKLKMKLFLAFESEKGEGDKYVSAHPPAYTKDEDMSKSNYSNLKGL